MRRLRGRVAVFVALAAVAIALDQLTKALALARLGNGIRVDLPGPLRGLRLVRNPGASLGLGSGSTWVGYASGFRDGAGVDFLDYGWSVGNVADVYLTLAGAAVVVLIICNVRFSDRSKTLKHGGAAK